jgi:hypothetical protein
MEKKLSSWTPERLEVLIKGLNTFTEAITEMEKIRPEGYVPTILTSFSHGIAWGELDMCNWGQEEQVRIVKKLEDSGWEWRK